MKSSILLFIVLAFFSLASAQINQTDAQGRKQGQWQKNYPGTAVLQYKGTFLNDKPVGKFIYNFDVSILEFD